MAATDWIDFTVDELTGMRKDARLALHALMLGKKPQTMGESNGAGSKSLTYTTASADQLRAHIVELDDAIAARTGQRNEYRGVFYVNDGPDYGDEFVGVPRQRWGRG